MTEIPGIPPTEEPGEPIAPPVEPTEPRVEPEPTTPPEVEPTSPVGGGTQPEGGDQGTSETLIQALFWFLVLVIIILGIGLIVSLFTGRNKESTSQPASTTADKPPPYAESRTSPPIPQVSPRSALDDLTPQVATLYDRFVNMLQAFGSEQSFPLSRASISKGELSLLQPGSQLPRCACKCSYLNEWMIHAW